MPARDEVSDSPTVAARERILESAYELFSQRGIRDVGVDEVIEHANVAKATLYRHFPSKDDLALAFLVRREERWTRGWVEAEARRRGTTPEEQLLSIFAAFDEWFRRPDFEACSFINVLLEMGARHPAGDASVRHLENIRSFVRTLAEEAGLRDPTSFAHSWHILMKGSIVAASEGDVDAARRAQAMGRLLIESHGSPAQRLASAPVGDAPARAPGRAAGSRLRSQRPMTSPFSHGLDVREVAQRLGEGNGGYEVVHASPGLELGVYVLVAPEPDRQQPHEWDEVYVVLEGRGTLTVEGEEIELEEGRAVYVKAGAKHRFSGYEGLSLLVVFDKSQPG